MAGLAQSLNSQSTETPPHSQEAEVDPRFPGGLGNQELLMTRTHSVPSVLEQEPDGTHSTTQGHSGLREMSPDCPSAEDANCPPRSLPSTLRPSQHPAGNMLAIPALSYEPGGNPASVTRHSTSASWERSSSDNSGEACSSEGDCIPSQTGPRDTPCTWALPTYPVRTTTKSMTFQPFRR